MAAQGELYPAVVEKLQAVMAGERVRITAVRRLALVITGLLAAKSSVVSQRASGLWEQGVTRSRSQASRGDCGGVCGMRS